MKKKPIIITVASEKGGCAKTTTVVSVAASLACLGKKTLILELDHIGNASKGLGVQDEQIENKSVSVSIFKGLRLPEVRLKTNSDFIDIVPAGTNLKAAIKEVTGTSRQYSVVSYLLNCPETIEYDFIFIDTHPYINCMLQSALIHSDFLLIPLFAEADAFDGIVDLIKEMNNIHRFTNPQLSLLGIVVTRFDSRNSTHNRITKELIKWGTKESIHIFSSIIPSSTAIAGARSAEKSILEYAPELPVSKAYKMLTDEILKEIASKNEKIKIMNMTPLQINSASEVYMVD